MKEKSMSSVKVLKEYALEIGILKKSGIRVLIRLQINIMGLSLMKQRLKSVILF